MNYESFSIDVMLKCNETLYFFRLFVDFLDPLNYLFLSYFKNERYNSYNKDLKFRFLLLNDHVQLQYEIEESCNLGFGRRIFELGLDDVDSKLLHYLI